MRNTETLRQALDGIEKEIQERGIFTSEDWREHFVFGGIPYGQFKTRDFKIDSIKGKNTKKYGHIVITRLDSGRYEPIFYVL